MCMVGPLANNDKTMQQNEIFADKMFVCGLSTLCVWWSQKKRCHIFMRFESNPNAILTSLFLFRIDWFLSAISLKFYEFLVNSHIDFCVWCSSTVRSNNSANSADDWLCWSEVNRKKKKKKKKVSRDALVVAHTTHNSRTHKKKWERERKREKRGIGFLVAHRIAVLHSTTTGHTQ